jgi:hypothetical protein
MLIAAAVLLSAGAGVANAADAKSKAIDFTVRTDASALSGAKSLKWDARKGRWGLTLNLEQTDTRESTWNDVQAGAYYKITPSLRVGGAVALGDEQPLNADVKKLKPGESAPRVRLETAFKF